MPCFGCKRCGKCSRATMADYRCVACGLYFEERIAVCPACGAAQPLPPGSPMPVGKLKPSGSAGAAEPGRAGAAQGVMSFRAGRAGVE